MELCYRDGSSYEGRAKLFELKADDDGTFTGHASIAGKKDLHDDIVAPGAFRKTIKKKGTFPLLWQHDRNEFIGLVEEASEDKRGLKIKGRLAMQVNRAREAFELLKAGFLKGLSIGFNVVVDEFQRDTGIRILKEIDLWEVSLVTFPAQPLAKVESVKSVGPFRPLRLAEIDRPWEPLEAQSRVLSSDHDPSEAFIVFDQAEERALLPVADVDDGELVLVPKALCAAALEIFQESSDLDSLESEAAKKIIGRHFRRLGWTPPWGEHRSFAELAEQVERLKEFSGDEPTNRPHESQRFDAFNWIDSEDSPQERRELRQVAELFNSL